MRLEEDQYPTRVHDSLLQVVGNTPLLRLKRMAAHLPQTVEVWVKLENMNPGGSIKDRTARQIITEAIARGELGAGQILLDATSGNTGIAYAMIGAALGIEVHLVMPQDVSELRKHIVRTYGAKIVFSDPAEGSDGAIRLAREIAAQDTSGRYFYADQYGNPSNPRAHELTMAPEIWRQTDGRITHFVAAMGTSGTVMGTGRGLKRLNADVQVIGCQPSEAYHRLEGLKQMSSGIIPEIYQESELDRVLYIDTADGWNTAERLAHEEGIAAGNSAGANVFAALKVAATLEKGVVVTVIGDTIDRYFGE